MFRYRVPYGTLHCVLVNAFALRFSLGTYRPWVSEPDGLDGALLGSRDSFAKLALFKTACTRIQFVVTREAVIIVLDSWSTASNATHLENTGFIFQLKLKVT